MTEHPNLNNLRKIQRNQTGLSNTYSTYKTTIKQLYSLAGTENVKMTGMKLFGPKDYLAILTVI